MYFLTYISQAAGNDAIDLDRLIKEARIRNSQNHVTGLLLFRSQTFIQLLEGGKKEVLTTFQKIAKDPRHEKIDVLFEVELNQSRIFPTWHMGLISAPLASPEQEALVQSLKSIVLSGKPDRVKILDMLQEFSSIAPPARSAAEIVAHAAGPAA